MRKILMLLLLPSLIFSETSAAITSEKNMLPKKISTGNVTEHNDTTYKIILNNDKTYGYEIFLNGKAFIRQYTIPGQRGIHGFKRKKDAELVAMLVIKKIQKGIMPPTISIQELKQLNIIF